MTTLYRTPNIVIDEFEWHAAVELRDGRISLAYRWRPLSLAVRQWSVISTWKGPKPKGMCDRFWGFRTHIRMAMRSEIERLERVAALKSRPSGATLRNAPDLPRRGHRARLPLAARAFAA